MSKGTEGDKKEPSKLKKLIRIFMCQFDLFFNVGYGQQNFLTGSSAISDVASQSNARAPKPLRQMPKGQYRGAHERYERSLPIWRTDFKMLTSSEHLALDGIQPTSN